jgi:hypothetical protein
MLKKLRKLSILFPILLIQMVAHAQEGSANKVEMADTMRSNGKIYVVVAVCLTILIGLILYLVRIERKIAKIERETSTK